ncbi:hypothetical protein BDR06DRAFT_961283 [Suillus hirtellus]|nr:hypothetical protein BDR06DRAFT_961283 [Suillus hirtellus]
MRHSIGATFLQLSISAPHITRSHEKMRNEASEKFYGAVLPCLMDMSRSIKSARTTRPPRAQKHGKPVMSYYHKPESYKGTMT